MFQRDALILTLSAVLLASFPTFGNAKKDTESSVLAGNPDHQPLCDFYGIQDEIFKAIEALKRKAEVAKSSRVTTPPRNTSSGQLRQDDDDDELPYYVAPIAKVVASVLAQNATNVIEESFGFIPPEINEQIRYVLNLVAETVAKLKPTEAPTEATTTPTPKVAELGTPPILANNSTTSVPQTLDGFNKGGMNNCVDGNCSNIESLVAYALAQQLANVIISKGGEGNEKPGSLGPNIPLLIQDGQTFETVEISTTPKFEYSEGLSVTWKEGLANSDIYAPAFAPNYFPIPSTSIPNYASAFEYAKYTTPSVESPTNQKVAAFPAFPPSTTGAPVEETTDYYDTTEDYDYYGGTPESTAAAAVTSPSVKGQGGVANPPGGVGVVIQPVGVGATPSGGNNTVVAAAAGGSDEDEDYDYSGGGSESTVATVTSPPVVLSQGGVTNPPGGVVGNKTGEDEDYDGRTGDNTEIRRRSSIKQSSPQLKLSTRRGSISPSHS